MLSIAMIGLAVAGGLIEGKFEGSYFNDSDLHKVLEGGTCSLADRPDAKLDKMFNDFVARMAVARCSSPAGSGPSSATSPGDRDLVWNDKPGMSSQ